jgi:predicted NACHT family NTPase
LCYTEKTLKSVGFEKIPADCAMRRGIKVAPECIPLVKQALRRHGFPSQKALALDLGVCRTTITRFFTSKPVDYLNFVEISERLGLDWQAIAYIEEEPPIQIEPSPASGTRPELPPGEPQNKDLDIDTLVQKVRQHCHNKIQMLYGKMQLLDISQPVDIDNLYVDVNILEEIVSQQWRELSDLLRGFNPAADDFDRLGIGRVRQKRVPGLEAVQKYSRLMVLGKPGSGKTTFLQYLAIQCNEGKFQSDRVPIFIRLKNFAKYARDEKDFILWNYISREFRSCGLLDQDVTETILNQGRGLILLDGLDEVPEEDEPNVVAQIEVFSQYYFKNQLIITCRIAASKYRFSGFTEIEVADFNNWQIKTFAEKWFVAFGRNDHEQGKALASQFFKKLNRPENHQIRELAVTPILLNLTCLVFQFVADFPSKRSKLYEQGLDILLRRWDEAKGIQRDKVYRDLDVEHKKELLNQVAAITFERGDYFFEQDKIQRCIAEYLRTLPDAKTDRARLQRDSEAVLKAIEAQHGLLVERARGIYSFSHLTFQEYFTARYFVESSSSQALENLSNHITEKRWREVFLLTTEMLPNAEG